MNNLFHFFKNLWNFRKELWDYRGWDYDFSLHMFRRSLQLLHDSIQEHSNEVLESRHLKLKAIERVIILLNKDRESITGLDSNEWKELWSIIEGIDPYKYDGTNIRTWWY